MDSEETSHLDVAYVAQAVTAAITVTREQLNEAIAVFGVAWQRENERRWAGATPVGTRRRAGLTAALTAIGFRVAPGPVVLTRDQAKLAEDAFGETWPEVRTKLAELGFEVESS
jgi:hypothetical protein